MSGDAIVLQCIEHAYRSPGEPAAWFTVAKLLRHMLESDACVIAQHDFARRRGVLHCHDGLSAEFVRSYPGQFSAGEPQLGIRRLLAAPDDLVRGERGGPHELLQATRFYREWLRPQGLLHGACDVIWRAGEETVSLQAWRRSERPPFEARHLRRLAILRPHLQRAWELAQRPQARALEPAWQVPAAAAAGGRAGWKIAGPRVAPTPARAAAPDERAQWASRIVTTRYFHEAPEAGRLRLLYQLTPAEARVAGLLARGASLRESAAALGVGKNTVRTHLQRIYDKTGTHRQSELVRLLLTGPAALHQRP